MATATSRQVLDAIAAMRQPFVMLDQSERMITWNRAYADLHCDDAGACVLRVGMPYDELTAWRLATGFFRGGATDVAAKGGSTYQLRDGRWMYVDRYRLPEGTNIGVWTDITSSKHAEEQLRAIAGDLVRSEERLLRAQRIAQIGSDERDFVTGMTTWSDETYRIFGVDHETFVVDRDNILALIHPDDRAAIASVFGNGIGSHEFRIVRPDRAERIILRESEIVRGPGGVALRRIGTFQDVTELRAREKLERVLQQALRAAKDEAEAAARALEVANVELERRVEERTRQLTAAQHELVKNERLSAIGQLTAIVAHELRNPLSAIRNTLFSMKSMAETSPALGRSVARMERSVERCAQIIGELLDYSRMRKLECEERCFDEWLAGVIDEQQVPERISLRRDLQAGAIKVSFDANRLRRVVNNLVENAAQALSGAGDACPEPSITLSTRASAAEIELVVADNGPGIAPDHVERIFEPLFSTKSFGTGLGLPMVRQIVEQHGGAVELASAPGQGARFVVRIPLHRAAAAA